AKGADNLVLKTGPYKGHTVTVDGPEYENAAGLGSNGGVFDPDYLLELNFYCDTYGICTITYGTLAAFVMECYQRGILDQERTGGLELTWGNAEADLEMMHQMARGEGFGIIAGQGIKKMKELFIAKGWGDPQLIRDIGMECKGLEYSEYISKESLAQQGGFALTQTGNQSDAGDQRIAVRGHGKASACRHSSGKPISRALIVIAPRIVSFGKGPTT
ncbi:MAG: aldehyde ferredoxin oxidoreductase C-terminal domain-containing protein, partial [Isosphaeraceae bacterium]